MRTLPKFLVSVALAAVLSIQGVFPAGLTFAHTAELRQYSAQDIKSLMAKLNDPSISEANKKRIAAVVFVHQDVYRDAVIRRTPGIPAKDADVEAFLKYKTDMQKDVIQRMNINERNAGGKGLSGPIIPFPYNNILSDDDIVLGSGESGKKMEGLYNQALNEVVQERAGRPMTAADRARIDVNGLAWDMTKEGGLENYFHHEKYINPQSGFANQEKLKGAGDKLAVYGFDPSSGMLTKLPPDQAKASLEKLATDKPLQIPGMDMSMGSGAMSDYARMADIHQVKFSGDLASKDVAQFIRNQKYTDRIVADFEKLAKSGNPQLAAEMASFIETSKKIRNQTNVVDVAKILQDEYKIPILDANGNVDWKKLEEAMKIHQTKQLGMAVPKMMGAVAQNEAYKMIEWLKGESANSAKRRALRKQLALTYAPLGEGALQSILKDLDAINASEADKAWLKGVLEKDTQQIREYAKLLEIPVEELAARVNMEGPSPRVVEYLENYHEGVQRFSAELTRRPGGGKFREFLKTKTAAALNLDTLIDGSPGEKVFQWSILLLMMTRAYTAANDNTEGMKAMGMAAFEMIPFVASVLRFSEMEFKESFKNLAMDILPPLALAQVAVTVLHFTAKTAINGFTEAAWNGLAREALKDFKKEDFEKTEAGYWRIRNREQYLEYLKEIEPGLGRVQKLASMVEPEVDARMGRDEAAKNNEAALYTLQYLEEIDIAGIRVHYSQGFSVDDIKKRVWAGKGALAESEAKNVERVAAGIILENMKIRADIYTDVLRSFIDRIENLYNEDEKSKDFDPSEVVAATQKALKALYENAPEIIRNDREASLELQAEYRKWVEYLKNYDSKGAEEMEVRRQMQKIIDDFKQFIHRLAVTVRLREEMGALNLRAHVFGGEKSTVETQEVLLDDTFRLGASATVLSSHGSDAWTFFYYVPSVNGGWRLLGTASPRGSATGGGEGMFVIDAQSQGTWITVPKKVIEEEFKDEGDYTVLPVIAFGAWSDPLNQVGLGALQNPMEYFDVFDENHVAFAGEEASFRMRRAKILLKTPVVVHGNEEGYVEVSLDVPEYAKVYGADAELRLFAEGPGRSPKLDPEKIRDISKDPKDPSKSRIRSEKDTADGIYWVEAIVKLKGFKDETAPRPQKKSFEFSMEKSDEEQAKEALAALRGLVGRMKKLDADSQEIMTRLQAAFDGWARDEAALRESAPKADAEIEKLRRLVSELGLLVKKVVSAMTRLRAASDIVNQAGESATEARTNCEKHVQGLCEAASKLMAGSLSDAKKTTLEGLLNRKQASFENQRERFRNNLEKTVEASRLADAESQNLSQVTELEPQVSRSLENLDKWNSESETLLSKMKDAPKEAKEAVPAHSAIVAEAGGIQTQASSFYSIASSLPDAAGPWQEIQALYAAIQGRQPTVENLAKEFEQKAAGLDVVAADWEKRKTGIRDEAAALLAQLPSPDAAKELNKTIADIKAGHDAVDLMTDSIQRLERQAGDCANRNIKPMNLPKVSKPQPQAANDSTFCGSTWIGRFVYDSFDRQGKPFPTEWFPPVDFTLWFDCGSNGMTGRIEETAIVEGRRVTVTAKVENIRMEGQAVRFTKIYDVPGAMGQTVEYAGEFAGPDEFSGQWTIPQYSTQYSAHFNAKRRKS